MSHCRGMQAQTELRVECCPREGHMSLGDVSAVTAAAASLSLVIEKGQNTLYRDGSAVKSACCSCRVPRFSSWHPLLVYFHLQEV